MRSQYACLLHLQAPLSYAFKFGVGNAWLGIIVQHSHHLSLRQLLRLIQRKSPTQIFFRDYPILGQDVFDAFNDLMEAVPLGHLQFHLVEDTPLLDNQHVGSDQPHFNNRLFLPRSHPSDLHAAKGLLQVLPRLVGDQLVILILTQVLSNAVVVVHQQRVCYWEWDWLKQDFIIDRRKCLVRRGIEQFQPFGRYQKDGNFRNSVVSLIIRLPQQFLKLVLHLHLIQRLCHDGWDLVEVCHIPFYLLRVAVIGKGSLKIGQFGMVALSGQLQRHDQEEVLQLGLILLVVESCNDLLFVATAEECGHVEMVERVGDGEVTGEALPQEVHVLAMQLFLVDLRAVEVVHATSHTYSYVSIIRTDPPY